jgi:hypothetical protein
MHDQSIENLRRGVPGKTILDHATWVAGRTGDYIIRRAALGREHKPFYNRTYRLKNPNPEALPAIVKEKAHWIGADGVGIAALNPLWIYTHWGMQNVMYSGAARAGGAGHPPRRRGGIGVIGAPHHFVSTMPASAGQDSHTTSPAANGGAARALILASVTFISERSASRTL